MDGPEVVYIDRVESHAVMRVVLAIGQREPLHCTATGKVLLAYRLPDEIRRILDTMGLPGFTRNTITDKEVLLQHLDLVRQRGYAVDDEEHSMAVRCFAFPVHDRASEVIASISIAGPAFRFTAETVERLTDDFLAVADQISARLGYRGALAREIAY
jgi:DNA-binding IclR family transcriptional regulator